VNVLMAVLGTVLLASTAYAADATGSLTIVGNGPELRMIESLARAFEKANPRAFIDVQWDEHAKPVELIKATKGDLAVTGKEEPDLAATQVGWDGIAVMVNLSNNTKDLTSQQIADIFSGKIKVWSDLGGPETRILIIDRPRHRNIRDTFEQQLGIAGQIADSAKVIGPDDKVIKTVAGTVPPLSPVTYISMGTALEAVSSGVAVRLLPVDKVEPEEPTVKDGRYKLRRPILFLYKKNADNAVIRPFLDFALSPDGQRIIDAEAYTPLDQKQS
jgi:phosphate transport system substrate-binding protein